MHWREPLDVTRHTDWFHPGVGGRRRTVTDSLIPAWSYFVRASGYTLEFASTAQLGAALEYFSQKLHPTSADPHAYPPEAGEWQQWHERLPKGLSRESCRQAFVQALEAALAEYGDPRPLARPEECEIRPFLDFLRDRGVSLTFAAHEIICQNQGRLETIPNSPTISGRTCTGILRRLGLDPSSFKIA